MGTDISNIAVILGSLTTIVSFIAAIWSFSKKQIQKQIVRELQEIVTLQAQHSAYIAVCAEERELLFDAAYNVLEWITSSHDDCPDCVRIKRNLDDFIFKRAHRLDK